MQNSLYRITAYAYISSLEICFKKIITTFIGSLDLEENKHLLPQEATKRATERLVKDVGFEIEKFIINDIINYFDYGDLLQIISLSKTHINDSIYKEFNQNYSEFEKIIAIRNAVMHSRPISFSDYHFVFELCSKLFENSEKTIIWDELVSLKQEIDKDSSYIFSKYKIPDEPQINYLSHNLPAPDYDETGLIGREVEEKTLKNLCLKQNISVISVIGEGGIGKTALTLKVAYDLLYDPNKPFDSVIWISSKTTKITFTEISEIKDAITSSIDIISNIAYDLSGVQAESLEAGLDEIRSYLQNFKIALFIDNLETILDDNIRKLVEDIGIGSKIIFTSRIGLGAYEHPLKLSGIDEKNATRFLRTLSSIRSVTELERVPEEILLNYVKRMNCNPSYIKWFVSCVQSGKTPEEVMQNPNKFLEFCMSNVYEYLNDDTKYLTNVLLCARGARELPELKFLTNYNAVQLQNCINLLLTTNMLNQKNKPILGTTKSSYELSELAQKFLSLTYPPKKQFRDQIAKKLKQLQSSADNYQGNQGNIYRGSAIQLRDKKDAIIVKQLNVAINFIKAKEFLKAQNILDELKALSPDYYEIHRTYAYFYKEQENIFEAEESYELAIRLAPKSPSTYYWYGRFLLDEGDSEKALTNLKKAYSFEKNSADLLITLIRANLYQKEFDDAHKLINQIDISKLDDYLCSQFFIVKIQYFYRLADSYCIQKNINKSLDELEQMKRCFSEVPIQHRHRSLIPYIKKSIVTLNRILKETNSNEVKRRTSEMKNWINNL